MTTHQAGALLLSATPAQRITAARAWGEGLAQCHCRSGARGRLDAGTAELVRLGAYRWLVHLPHDPAGDPRADRANNRTHNRADDLADDLADEVAAVCGWLGRLPGPPITRRACLRAFLEGYRRAGGTVVLKREIGVGIAAHPNSVVR
ncbi:MAG: hypothetical protein JWO63_2710 [Frankiales bacterium]|jgi:hypothetical protein|nr:hypothetical protein [Frankiales bacterium]